MYYIVDRLRLKDIHGNCSVGKKAFNKLTAHSFKKRI